jgi:hypothetical protein
MADDKHGDLCPKARTGEHKYEDLVVAADDGKIYYLKREDYIDPKREITEQTCAHCYHRIVEMLQQGVALGWIRPRPGNQACYLVNLSSLRRVTPWEKPSWTPDDTQDPVAEILASSEQSDIAAQSATAAALAIDIEDTPGALFWSEKARLAAHKAVDAATKAQRDIVAYVQRFEDARDKDKNK